MSVTRPPAASSQASDIAQNPAATGVMADQANASADYRVLARKYRPVNLDGLRGQDVLVRTLRHAVESGRIAQAFLLTGVRGVGKTTTARILARILNCVGPDGSGGVTAEPCGTCEQCTAIAGDRHVDVLEIDAASHTGIDNMRDLLESARYRPVMGRYKIYVMDEVHMLSNAAFNALLKTLEEPPEHLKFVFATTELRKIPATILSRCQRFDLRRVDARELAGYFGGIVAKERAEASDKALELIARAADGSVRDGLSILDQALAQGQGKVVEDDVRDMLGLADRGRILDLHEAVMGGRIADALAVLDGQYAAGVDPVSVLEDLLEFTHWLTRYKSTPEAASHAAPEFERVHGAAMADKLGVPHLTRAWQILLKGIGEARTAPNSRQAADMTLVRLAYSADLPTVEQALRALDRAPASKPGRAAAPPAVGPTAPEPESPAAPPARTSNGRDMAASPPPDDAVSRMPGTFEELLSLLDEKKEALLSTHLRTGVHLVSYSPGHIEFRPGETAPADLARDLADVLERSTGRSWTVTGSNRQGEATYAEQEKRRRQKTLEAAAREPGVAEVLRTFPGARVVDVRTPESTETENHGR